MPLVRTQPVGVVMLPKPVGAGTALLAVVADAGPALLTVNA